MSDSARELLASPLFDAAWYRVAYPEIGNCGLSPAQHYLEHGAKLGFDPGPWFSTRDYLSRYPDVLVSGTNPLLHYINFGIYESRSIVPSARGSKIMPSEETLSDVGRKLISSPLFDTSWYLATYPEVERFSRHPVMHYLEQGVSRGFDPSPQFSTGRYLSENPDVAASGDNPLLHYLLHGMAEQRAIYPSTRLAPLSEVAQILADSPLFDAEWYLATYPAVAQSGAAPAAHYLDHGAKLGFDPGPWFSTELYLMESPDVAVSGTNPLLHYILHGLFEGRSIKPSARKQSLALEISAYIEDSLDSAVRVLRSSPFFDSNWYVRTYPGVKESGLDPALHYLTKGAEAGFDPHPRFDTRAYLSLHPDVGRAGNNPLMHYVLYGMAEGREFEPSRLCEFSAEDGVVRSILYVSGEPDTPGNQYRVIRYADAAARIGVKATWIRYDEVSSRLEEFHQADLLVLWRTLWNQDLLSAVAIMRSRGKRVVFDVDDLMTEPDLASTEIIDGIRSQNLTEDGTRAHYAGVRSSLLPSDACISPTEELAYYMRSFGKPTFVLPNGFDSLTLQKARNAVRRRRAVETDSLVRIGYAGGSRTHQRDFGLAVEAIARILREKENCRLVLFKSRDAVPKPLVDVEEFPALVGLEDKIEWRWLQPMYDLPDELARFDINIAPLEFGNPFCEAKSELKFFEAALVEVPTVASPTGPYRRAIDHGKTGFLASNADEWYIHLVNLVDNQALCAKIGRQAYYAALAKYGPMQRVESIGRVIAQLGGGQAAAHAWALDARLATQPRKLPTVFDSNIVFERDRLDDAAVTVVIPLYNYEHYIVEALESVAAQTLDPLDLVVVDGCSTDNSLGVALKWAQENESRFNRIVVMQNTQNCGLGICRNSGFDMAETPYVLLLDADNRLLPTCCESLLGAITENYCAFAYGIIQQFGETDGLMSNMRYEPQRFVPGNYIDAMALVSKEAWCIIGGVNHVRFGWEDYDFWCRLAESGLQGVRHPAPVAEYRTHVSSMRFTQTTVKENSKRLFENFTGRHPWVRLGEQHFSRQLGKPMADFLPDAESGTLKRLLSILRCPETKQKLSLSADGKSLISVDGLKSWPVMEGRPVLAPGNQNPTLIPKDHQSNPLPEAAIKLIREAKGLVLNLSAGATSQKYENVVEAEYSIFRNTDLVADAHELPFDDESFDAVLSLNAFEHYRNPHVVAEELKRVLKPGGYIYIATAFMQPLHEKPHHYYNCTRYGLAEWFKAFEDAEIEVSPNFSPNFTLGWLLSESEAALRHHISGESADAFKATQVETFLQMWRDPAERARSIWTDFQKLPQDAQEITAAGFQYIGRRPLNKPKL